MYIELRTFEVFVVSIKNKYERLTRSSFVEDFGTQILVELRDFYEMGVSQDEIIGVLMNRQPRLARCACECGSAFVS